MIMKIISNLHKYFTPLHAKRSEKINKWDEINKKKGQNFLTSVFFSFFVQIKQMTFGKMQENVYFFPVVLENTWDESLWSMCDMFIVKNKKQTVDISWF